MCAGWELRTSPLLPPFPMPLARAAIVLVRLLLPSSCWGALRPRGTLPKLQENGNDRLVPVYWALLTAPCTNLAMKWWVGVRSINRCYFSWRHGVNGFNLCTYGGIPVSIIVQAHASFAFWLFEQSEIHPNELTWISKREEGSWNWNNALAFCQASLSLSVAQTPDMAVGTTPNTRKQNDFRRTYKLGSPNP